MKWLPWRRDRDAGYRRLNEAHTISNLIVAGFTHESVIEAVEHGDITRLQKRLGA